LTAFIQKTPPNRQKLFFATLCRSSKALLWTGLLFCIHCSNEVEKETNAPKPPAISTTESPDLAKAIEKRIEGNSDEAIRLLRLLNQTYPNTPEVLLQLARALFESKQFELAAFRFDQVNSIKSSSSVYRESGLAYEYADDFKSAISRYSSYLSDNSGDEEIWLRIARLYALNGEDTEALNAFSKGSEKSTYDDCIMMADLFYSKKLTQQAEFWYQEASRKIEGVQPEPLLGLLRIRLMEKENQNAESLILAIEKSHPGTIEETDLDKEAAVILKQRRLADFISRGLRN
jgi:tetratricopeptide (TPR) repeat protein